MWEMFCPFANDIVFYLFVNQGISVYSGVPVVLGDVKMIFEEKKITDWSTIKSTLKDNLREYIFQKTKRNPMILPIIMEI